LVFGALMEITRKRAVEAFWILNDFIGDLITATRAFEFFDTPKFKKGATDRVVRFYHKMADSYLFVTLAKWIEFYDHYRKVIPHDMLPTCKRLRKELVNRGMLEFRNTVVGHIWSNKKKRPLLPEEIDHLYEKITSGNSRDFLKWINDPSANDFGVTVVGTSEAVRDAIKNKWSLSVADLT
jgi:hypothetical protein